MLWSHTSRFIQERKILNNVSPSTLSWYRYSLKAFQPVLEADFESTGTLKAAVIARIEQLQSEGRGNKAVSVNTYLRCLKAFLNWCFEEQILKERFKLAWLREETKILATFSPSHIHSLVNWKPITRSDLRLHTLVLAALDTGMRVEELVSLQRNEIDFEASVIRVKGKGNKYRLVPMSVELRKRLYRYLSKCEGNLVFCTLQTSKLSKRNLLRDFKELCVNLNIIGVRCSLHTCRHTFSVSYLRSGGNLYYLQRILGHTSITTTERYVRSLGIEDIVKVHSSHSLLSC